MIQEIKFVIPNNKRKFLINLIKIIKTGYLQIKGK